MQQASAITVDSVKALVSKKSHLHEACERNNYYMPKLGSSICTIDFMMAVRNRECFCPQYTCMQQRPCPKPPARKVVKQALLHSLDAVVKNATLEGEVRSQCKTLMQFLDPKDADLKWMLTILACINPDHEYFQKGYVAPKTITSRSKAPTVITNDDNFFSGLPQQRSKGHSSIKFVKSDPAADQIENLER